ncbi:MAG TPA: hypothetical protein VFI84_00755, partial [Candidatus Saccharimonadales bacterium]|nr:hypothetical protein [Candidatus Saccharimonadales bacterium]
MSIEAFRSELPIPPQEYDTAVVAIEAVHASKLVAAQEAAGLADMSFLESDDFDIRWGQLSTEAITALKTYWSSDGVDLNRHWFPRTWSRRAEDVLTSFSLGYSAATEKLFESDTVYNALAAELERVSKLVPDNDAAYQWRPVVKAALRLRGDELEQYGSERVIMDDKKLLEQDPAWAVIILKLA